MTYILTTTTANYNQGILNIPTRFSEYFGAHGSNVTLELGNNLPIISRIDRNNVTNRSPRTTNRSLLYYFQDSGRMGSSYQVTISPNKVSIALLRK